MAANRERRMLIAGIGAMGAMAISRTARAATCGDVGPTRPTGPTMRDLSEKIAQTDQGIAEARTPITSCVPTATALYSITSPGVYYMTGNINGVSGMSVIEVLCDDVEIECDGFMFLGAPGALTCIRTPNSQKCIGFYDGGFSDWPAICIDFSNSLDCYVEESTFRRCTCPPGSSVCTLGTGGIIDDCNVLSCTNGKLSVGANGVIEECVHRDSTGGCFYSPGPAVMEDNFALNNDDLSFRVGHSAVLIGNRVYLAGGMSVGDDSVVAENDLTGCPVAIEVTGQRVTVEENHVSSGNIGLYISNVSGRVLVDGNHVTGSSSTGIKIEIGAAGCLVVRNTVSPPSPGSGYSISAGNSYGTIVNAIGVGDLGGSGTAIDAWSNFEY